MVPISKKRISNELQKNIHSALNRFTLVRCSRSLITPPNLWISLGAEAKVKILKLFVIVSASSPVVLESCIFDLTSYGVFHLKKRYWKKPKMSINTKKTTPILVSCLRTTTRINGKNIIILRILKRKLSIIFSNDQANLFIFFTSAPEKLLVKKLNECLWIYAKHCS